MMKIDLEDLLSSRIVKHCIPLYRDGHYKSAAREAMVQVELGLKEKGMVKDKRYGRTLVASLFKFGNEHKNIKLRVPLSEDLQDEAKSLFEGIFAYYQ